MGTEVGGGGVRVRGSVFHESQSPFLESSGIGTPGGGDSYT